MEELAEIENPYLAIKSLQSTFPTIKLELTVATDFKVKAYDFIKRFWKDILTESCAWWNEHKNDKQTSNEGQDIIKGVGDHLKKAIPSPWNIMGGILAIITVIVLRGGLDAMCIEKPSEPPTIVSK